MGIQIKRTAHAKVGKGIKRSLWPEDKASMGISSSRKLMFLVVKASAL